MEQKTALETLILDSVSSLKYNLVKILLSYGKSKDTVRVIITHPTKAIGADDCTLIADVISRRLDIDDPFTRPYDLIVESPGLEYEIKSFDEYQYFFNKDFKLVLTDTSSFVNAEGIFIGNLQAIGEDTLTFTKEGLKEPVILKQSDIKKARLYCDFDKILKNNK